MDGVLIDHTGLKIKLAKDRGWDILPKESNSDILRAILPGAVLEELWYMLYHDPIISLASPLMKGVNEGLDGLLEAGISYYLVSRRRDPLLAQELLGLHGLWPKYFNEENSSFVGTREDKNVKAVELGITHYVDDEPAVLEKLIDIENRFLLDPHDSFKDENYYTRVNSWDELLNHLLAS